MEEVKKQVPTNREAAREQAKNLAKKVPAPPLPAGSVKLDAMRKRAKALQEKHAAYLRDIAAGKKVPLSHLREARPRHEREVLGLQNSLAAMVDEKDPAKREVLSKAFFAALQPLGPLLEHADPGKGHVNILSKQQQVEMNRLEQMWQEAEAGPAKDAAPSALGPGQLYTVTNLSVPLVVKTAPSSTVLFQTHGGGLFPNKLAITAVKADGAGIAKTHWVTYGDSIADTLIGVRREGSSSPGEITITTVQLKLRELPALPAAKVPTTPPVK